MPLGLVASVLVMLSVAALVPVGYAFLWPGGISRIAAFLTVGLIVGIFGAVVALIWVGAPLDGIGIAGGTRSGSGSSDALVATLQRRYALAAVALFLFQAIICRGLQALWSK